MLDLFNCCPAIFSLICPESTQPIAQSPQKMHGKAGKDYVFKSEL